MSRASLLIPVRASDENVEVFVDELPEDADDILAILIAEIAPLDIWLKFAVEYYRQGKIESFLKILNEGTDPDLEEYYADSKTERIALLNALASYYTQLASRERDNNKKDEYYRQATGTFNKADKIDAFEFLTWVGKGVLFLCKGDLDRATYNFDTVLQNQPDNIPAIMGKACVQFNKGQYQEALATYKLILVKNPSCPPAVRLGLGYCFYKLGRTDLARQAFERVLQLDPTNVEALVGLAIFELNTEKQGSITSAMHMLKKAFEANNYNSMVLNHIANHFFFKKDYQKVHTLALQAYHNTEVPQIKAFSCYLLAKSYHAQHELENAYNYYAQALRHWPSFDLAQFGVAQMLIHKEQPDSAITYFESVLTSHPDNFETLKMLGSLYAQSKNKDKAKLYLKKATELNSGDYEAWIELAQLTELTDLPGALAAYEKAKQLLQKRKEKVSAELWNNLAVLRHKLGNLKGAEEAYKGALIASGNAAADNANEFTKEVKAQTVTMLYNLARLYEDMHEPTKAEELYMSILKEHPNYVDCYMRLGCIERDRKQYSAASTWFRECLVISQENHDTWALIGNMHLGKEEWQQAQKKFEKIIEKDRSDPYSLLSLGNIYYNAKFNTAEKEAKYVRLAHDFYWKVLQRNPSNIYAANGIGIVFAEKGEVALAKEFFTQVSESTENMADVRLNLAHIHFAQGMFINAVKLYENCLKKYYENKDPDVILCLARAYFEWDKMEECKQTLQKAIHLDPTNQIFWFNLALAQFKNATMILKMPRRTFSDILSASKDADSATSIFTTLSQPKGSAKPAYSVSKVQRYVKLCTQLQQSTQTKRQEAEKHEAEQAKRRAMQQEKQEEAERVLREKREKEEAEEAEKRAEEERMVAQMMEQQHRVLEKYTNPEPEPEEEGGERRKKKKKSGKKKKSKREEEQTEEMQEGEGAEEGAEEGAGEGVEEGVEDGAEEGETDESWQAMRDRRNPMAKELARKQKEREHAKHQEKKRRRGSAEDEEVVEDEEGDAEGEHEKRKSKKSRGKQTAQEEEEGEEEELPAENAEESVDAEHMEQEQPEEEQAEQEQPEEEQPEGESTEDVAQTDEIMDTAANDELPPTQVD